MNSFPNVEPDCFFMYGSNCCFLRCIQISQKADKVVWYSHLLNNFPQFFVIHTVKDFGIVNKVDIDVLLELSCVFYHPVDIGNLNSGFSAFSKSSLYIWEFLVHILLKPSLKDFDHYLSSMWDECNCAVVWAFFGIAFLWDWNENWPGEVNGYPLQDSCLEAWRLPGTEQPGITRSQTQPSNCSCHFLIIFYRYVFLNTKLVCPIFLF